MTGRRYPILSLRYNILCHLALWILLLVLLFPLCWFRREVAHATLRSVFAYIITHHHPNPTRPLMQPIVNGSH